MEVRKGGRLLVYMGVPLASVGGTTIVCLLIVGMCLPKYIPILKGSIGHILVYEHEGNM